jgi:hypothetical protein
MSMQFVQSSGKARGRDRMSLDRGITSVAALAAALLCVPAAAQQVPVARTTQSLSQSGGTLPVLPPIVSSTPREDALIGVAERYRPEFQADGVRLGSFLVYPSVRTAAGYDSNIFGQQDNVTDDALYVVEPVVSARSTWAANELRLEARGRFLDYLGTDHASETTYLLAADGRLSLSAPMLANVGASFGQNVERRDSSSFPDGSVGPVHYRVANAYARWSYDFGALNLVGSTDYTRFDFSDTNAIDADGDLAGRIDQQFRDHQVFRFATRAEVPIGPRISLFGQAGGSLIHYDDKRIFSGLPNRDADELQLLAGVNFNIALLRGEIGAGYVRHDYDAALYPTLEGFALQGKLIYFLTPLLTLTAEGSRTVEETAIINASGFFSTRGQLRADYELLRNLILNANVSYRDNRFRGVDRKDRIFRLGGGGRYLASRRINLDFDFFVIDRNVDDAPQVPDFTEFRGTAGITFRL